MRNNLELCQMAQKALDEQLETDRNMDWNEAEKETWSEEETSGMRIHHR